MHYNLEKNNSYLMWHHMYYCVHLVDHKESKFPKIWRNRTYQRASGNPLIIHGCSRMRMYMYICKNYIHTYTHTYFYMYMYVYVCLWNINKRKEKFIKYTYNLSSAHCSAKYNSCLYKIENNLCVYVCVCAH